MRAATQPDELNRFDLLDKDSAVKSSLPSEDKQLKTPAESEYK